MFFHDKIKSIKEGDKVLEIGPGATPYFRSDVFLELEYETVDELIAQSGHVGILETEKKIITYTGGRFPFNDKEFDYVVCSHVLEHVNNIDFFLSEIQRVSNCGYLEFPTLYYDYIYNFPEHINFLFYQNGKIKWMTKKESGLNKYAMIQKLFYKSCELGYYDTINIFKNYFFQGFEWFDKIENQHVTDLNLLTFSEEDSKTIPFFNIYESSSKDYSTISFWSYMKYRIKHPFKKIL